MTLLTGTLLARGRPTVAAALRASGNDQVLILTCLLAYTIPRLLITWKEAPHRRSHLNAG